MDQAVLKGPVGHFRRHGFKHPQQWHDIGSINAVLAKINVDAMIYQFFAVPIISALGQG
tara:strand:+ start:626 stop:802 length:177 start_codon:yes stop_codon:yes gene_type:complete